MADSTFACPSCSQHIKCDESALGSTLTCPSCGQVMVVPFAAPPAPPPARGRPSRSTPADPGLHPPTPQSVWTEEVKLPWKRILPTILIVAVAACFVPVLQAWLTHRERARLENEWREEFAPPPQLNTRQQAAFQKFSASLAAGWNQGGANSWVQICDMKAVAYFAVRDLPLAPKLKRALLTSATTQDTDAPSIIATDPKAVCVKLRDRTAGGFPSALFRFHHENGNAFYWEVLARPSGTSFVIVDMNSLTLGIKLSDWSRATTIPMLSGLPRGVAAQALGWEGEPSLLFDIEAKGIVEAYKEGRNTTGAFLPALCPAEIRDLKMTRILEAITYRRSHSTRTGFGGPGADPIQIMEKELARPVQQLVHSGFASDGSVLKGTRGELEEADAELGGDPYVQCLIASNELETGAPSSAAKLLHKAVTDDPTLLDMTAGLRLRVASKLGDFPAMRDELQRLADSSPQRMPAALTGVDVAEFLTSEEGRPWRDRLNSIGTQAPQ